MVKAVKKRFEREVVQIVLTGPDFTDFMKTVQDGRAVHGWIYEWAMVCLITPIGYKNLNYLVYDHAQEPSGFGENKRDALINRAINNVKDKNNMGRLPKHFYLFDRNKAIETYTEGVKAYGLGWYSDGGADRFRYSNVIQMALFGEVVYA